MHPWHHLAPHSLRAAPQTHRFGDPKSRRNESTSNYVYAKPAATLVPSGGNLQAETSIFSTVFEIRPPKESRRKRITQSHFSRELLNENRSVRYLSASPEPHEASRTIQRPHRPSALAKNSENTTTEAPKRTNPSFSPISQTAHPNLKCEVSGNIPGTR